MDDNDDMYDEFGNLIGDAASSEDEVEMEQAVVTIDQNQALEKHAVNSTEGEIIYVKHDETMFEEPVIKPDIQKVMKEETEQDSNLNYSKAYLKELMNNSPERIRNVAVVGNIHSGKTTLMDQLIYYTHKPEKKRVNRFLDNHKLEIDREVTIKSSAISLLLPDSRDRSHVINFIDTPGQVEFNDEMLAALNGVEGVILVIDVIEGLTSRGQMIIDEIIKLNLPIILILNKFDSFILNLKLPPNDTYLKLNYIIDEINEYIQNNEYYHEYKYRNEISPKSGTVFFASAEYGFIFNLASFTKMYFDNQQDEINSQEFAGMLWGEYYFDKEESCLCTESNNGQNEKSFVSFILNPIYKIITYTLTHEFNDKRLAFLLWENFKLSLSKKQYREDPKDLLKTVFHEVFKNYSVPGLIDSLQEKIQSPLEVTEKQGITFDSTVGQVLKLVESSNGKSFSALVRVYHGSLKTGETINIYGEDFNYDKNRPETETITKILIPQGRSEITIDEIGIGNIVLVEGIESSIKKGATIVSKDMAVKRPFTFPKYNLSSVFKVAIEPYKPSELPLMLEGLRKIDKSYLASIIHVEESGEHTLICPGELYMDCVLHDIRFFFNDDLQIRVSDPMVKFSETCIDMSFTKIPIKMNHMQISVVAEPIDDLDLTHNLETSKINMGQSNSEISSILKSQHKWDVLAARSLWSIGSELSYPSILIDDTLELESNKKALLEIKDLVTTGFQWVVSEGPLINETIRNVKFKILDFEIDDEEVEYNAAQIIPMVRNACYTALLLAHPRLLEPIFKIMTICTYKAIRVLSELLKSRRGYIDSKMEIPGTPFFEIIAHVPAIDSMGLTSDLKLHTQNQAKCQLVFDFWDLVPGDPLDETKQLFKLKPVEDIEALARDCLVKTRKRKGLTGEPSLQKYIDTDIYIKLKEKNLI